MFRYNVVLLDEKTGTRMGVSTCAESRGAARAKYARKFPDKKIVSIRATA